LPEATFAELCHDTLGVLDETWRNSRAKQLRFLRMGNKQTMFCLRFFVFCAIRDFELLLSG